MTEQTTIELDQTIETEEADRTYEPPELMSLGNASELSTVADTSVPAGAN
jgi:hypothetical protein